MKAVFRVVKGLLSLLIICGLVSVGHNALAANKKPIEMNFANFYSSAHKITGVLKKWAREVEKRTNGRVKITFYDGQSLCKVSSTYEMITNGTVEIGNFWPTYQSGTFPISGVANIPFMLEGPRQGGPTMWEFYKGCPEFQKELSKIKPLILHTTDIKNFHTVSKLIRTLEDFKGMRMGCGAGVDTKVLTLLGATPIQTRSTSDLYLALQRGTADGIYLPWAYLKASKMMDLVHDHTIVNMAVVPGVIGMNKQLWDSLPADIKKVFNDLSLSTSAFCGYVLANYGDSIKKEMKQRGDTFYKLPSAEKKKFVKAVAPMLNSWKELIKVKRYNPDSVLKAFTKVADKYLEIPYKPDAWWSTQ